MTCVPAWPSNGALWGKITDYETWFSQTDRKSCHVFGCHNPNFSMLLHVVSDKKGGDDWFSSQVLGASWVHDELPTWTHGGWLQRETLTNLFSEAFFVYSARWWSLSYFSTSCQQLSRPLSPGQCSTERPHLWVGRSGEDAGHSTINLDSVRNPGHCPGGEFGPRGKIIKRNKKTFLPFRCFSPPHTLSISPPASSYPPCRGPPRHKRHGVYEICLRWMIADWIYAYWTLNICNILQYHYFPP